MIPSLFPTMCFSIDVFFQDVVFAWQLTSTADWAFESGFELAEQLQTASFKVLKPGVFESGHFDATKLEQIKRSGFRFVILLAFDDDMTAVAQHSAVAGMTGGWAWLVPYEQLQGISDMIGWLFPRPMLPTEGIQAFAKQVSDYTKSKFDIPLSTDSVDLPYAAALYDAIMLFAHAATKVMSEGGDLYDAQAVTAAVRNTTIKGVGGGAT